MLPYALLGAFTLFLLRLALTVQFVQGIFVEKYDPTIEDSYVCSSLLGYFSLLRFLIRFCFCFLSFVLLYSWGVCQLLYCLFGLQCFLFVLKFCLFFNHIPQRKQIEVDGQQCMLEILDTAGTEQFTAMRDLYMKNGQGFVLVYSIIALGTFNDLPEMREQILRVKDTNKVPMILVGNKVCFHFLFVFFLFLIQYQSSFCCCCCCFIFFYFFLSFFLYLFICMFWFLKTNSKEYVCFNLFL